MPVSGTFTPEQRKIYQLVRDAQAAAERNAKPGKSPAAARRLVGRGSGPRASRRSGLIESEDATLDPPWHGGLQAQPRVQAGDSG